MTRLRKFCNAPHPCIYCDLLFDIPQSAKKVFYPSVSDYESLEDEIISKSIDVDAKPLHPTSNDYKFLDDSIILEELVSKCGDTTHSCVYRSSLNCSFMCDAPRQGYICQYRVFEKRTA
jgi:hypothetical protein